ncbi:MAG TPA: hypothetical protein VEQ35_02775, partial [Beijerinckia sp.]|nr:hypothetical protein [Beijerinckia sp.]
MPLEPNRSRVSDLLNPQGFRVYIAVCKGKCGVYPNGAKKSSPIQGKSGALNFSNHIERMRTGRTMTRQF